MYKAYLSYTLVVQYLKFLQDSDLLTYDEGTQHYSVTEKGVNFLMASDKLNGLWKSTES